MTIEQAIRKLLAEAEYHRSEDRWDVGHEWQRKADELAHLFATAKGLPNRPKPKKKS